MKDNYIYFRPFINDELWATHRYDPDTTEMYFNSADNETTDPEIWISYNNSAEYISISEPKNSDEFIKALRKHKLRNYGKACNR